MTLSDADFETMADDHSGKYDDMSAAYELGHVSSTLKWAIRAIKDGRVDYALNELETALARIDKHFEALHASPPENGH